MGAWSTSIGGNDTAMDLQQEYCAAFYKYPVDEALEKIDSYVREHMCDESDEEEFCNYYYSLADFMWKKGILTDAVRDKAVSMIDSGFGLDIWAESGDKIFNARKKALSEFRQKLLSPQPKKKSIKPNVNVERIFEDGDIIAVQLQTAGKKYTHNWAKPMSEEEFHSYDGKYVDNLYIEGRFKRNGFGTELLSYALSLAGDGAYEDVPEDKIGMIKTCRKCGLVEGESDRAGIIRLSLK